MNTVLLIGMLAAGFGECQAVRPSVSIGPAPYVFMVAGNVADLWTTKTAIDGGAVEANPLLARQPVGKLAVAKISSIVVMVVLMRVMETHNHPKVAQWFGYLEGSATFAVAAHNANVIRQLRK